MVINVFLDIGDAGARAQFNGRVCLDNCTMQLLMFGDDTAKEESLVISLKCLTGQSACAACAALNNFCRCLCVLITCWQVDHVTVACLASLYQQCRLSFTDCLLNGGSHFEEASCVQDYFVGHNVSMVGRCDMSHMQSYAISAALYTMYTASYTYTYIIRKGRPLHMCFL